MNDIQQGPSFPTNPAPTDGMLWCLTSGSAPYLVYRYNGTSKKWEPTTYTSLSSMDPTASGQLTTAYNGINDLGDDSKITRYERSVVRGQINDITGLWLNPTDSMPALATIDASAIGSLGSLRKSARNIGVATGTGTNYANVGANYTALANYLNSLSPKPWDTASTGTTTITPSTWQSKWKAFYDSLNLLQVDVQNRQKAYTDAQASNAQSGAIAAVQNAVAHATAAIANPMTINAPVATIGLPEFNGRHFDSWNWNGRNLLRNTDFRNGLDNWSNWGGSATREVVDFNGKKWVHLSQNDSSRWRGVYQIVPDIKPSTPYTVSFIAYSPNNSVMTTGFHQRLGDTIVTQNWQTYTLTNSPKKYSYTFTTTGSSIDQFNFMIGNDLSPFDIYITDIKLEPSNKASDWTPAPEDTWGSSGNRIKPITSPTFSTGTSLTMNVSAYGDGTNNDRVYWDNNGNLVKQQLWQDVNIDGTENWSFNYDGTGYKTLKATGFASSVTDGTLQVVKYDAAFLTVTSSRTAGDQATLSSSDNALYITVKDTDSGWGENYSPTSDEITAYFLGWKMCNGTYNTPYNGSGTKTWYPIGDTDLKRAYNTTAGVPTEASPTIGDTINPYQVVYRLGTPVLSTGYTFDGLLTLIQGDNTINIDYPEGTPAITSGTIKYATNLATYTQDLSYIIPQTMTRVANAEQKVNEDSIVATVTNSLEFTTALAEKANTEDVSDLASQSDLETVKDAVDELDKTVNGDPDITDQDDPNYGGLIAKFSKYYTKTEVDTLSTGIKESFYQGGGMNLVQNSVGYAKLDFWLNYSAYPVQIANNNELDTLGFGSGFYFAADGHNKGIIQQIDNIPIGQHFTLSWYLNKLTKGSDSSYRFFIQIQEYINGAWTVVENVADNSSVVTNGYEASYINYIANAPSIRIAFIGYGNCAAYLTGIMFTIGDVPIKWTLATGEAYNTYINMNINGIRVSHIEDKTEVGYTMMSSDEFAGYYDTNGDGVFEKVFYLNGDETVSKKVRAINELTMGPIKIIKAPAAPEWTPNTPYNVGDSVSNGANVYQCTVAGVSGTTAPSFTSGTGTDGTVTWSFVMTSANVGWAFVKV